MSQPTRRRVRNPERAARPSGRRRVFVAVTVILAVAMLAAGILLRGGASRGADWRPAFSGAQGNQAAASAPAADGFGTLNGRWLRPDGGYILEIRDVDTGGPIDVVYRNPRPINVARAEATRAGSALRVFIELRAPGYPGSTYTLTYDPKRDQLEGVYFQAALQQSFDVVFVRSK